MPVTPVISITDSASARERLPIQTLGQADFLKLLVTQMTSQDPLNPQKDSEFIAQMAQFSALEQSKAMQSDMAKMRSDQQVLQATALLGQTVAVQVGQEAIARGVVTGVQIVAGTPKLMVDGNPYDLSQVFMVTPTPPAPLP